MKVLFVGEGRHDVGHNSTAPDPEPAAGMLTVLSMRICPTIDDSSIALRWVQVNRLATPDKKRFLAKGKTKGNAAKVAAAILLGSRKYGCDATVCVADCDREENRLHEMEKGIENGQKAIGEKYVAVCGLAIQSIDAWTLGAPAAIAAELGVEVSVVEKQYPKLKIEELYEKSGKEPHRPKPLLKQLANLRHREDSTEFREEVAKRTDLLELEKNCPQGFQTFAKKLRLAFGTVNDGDCGIESDV